MAVSNENNLGTPPIPDPETIKTPGMTDALKRKLFFAVVGLIVLVILSGVFAPSTPAPRNIAATREQKRSAQTPTVQQIADLKKSIDASAELLQQNLERDNKMAESRGTQKQTLADMQAADALREAQQQRALSDATRGLIGLRADPRQQRAEQAYKSLFSDNRVTQGGQAVSFSGKRQTAVLGTAGEAAKQELPLAPPDLGGAVAGERPEREPEHKRRPLDFNPAAATLYWLPEGTVIEAELTNRLDGEQPGPVNVMITNDVYKPGTRLVLIPQGARALGEAKQVSGFGQQRLAVAFHRILTPGLDGYGIPLDKLEPGLGQAGETGLHDKVNSHYASIFGASLAIGTIGGLAQIGNSGSTLSYDPSAQFRNGVSQSMAQSADHVLDRFLNRMPTITIREGTRIKIVLTDDLSLPAYHSKGE